MPVDDTTPNGGQALAVEAMMATSRLMTAVVARTFTAVDDSLSVPQLRVVVMLYYGAPMNLRSIAEGLGVNASNATRACDKLVVAGLVSRNENPEDRRHRTLELTKEGRGLVQSLMTHRRAILDEIIGQLSPTEQRRLSRGLTAFLAAAEESSFMPSSGGNNSIIPWMR